MKTVLYLNGKIGVWMQFERDTCVNVHAESLCIGQAGYQPCAWLTSELNLVHLIVDNEQSEIDAFALQPSGSVVGQLSHRKALRKSLISRYPDAIIATPAKSTGLDSLLVQKVNLSEQIRHWLAYVEQSAITFCSVATCSETVAKLFAGSDQTYLVITKVLGYYHHTFCHSGHALFTRTLEYSEDISIIDGLEETLSHLRTTELIQAAVRVCFIGCADKQLSGIEELEWVDGLVKFEETALFDAEQEIKYVDNMMLYSVVIHIARHALKQTAHKYHNSKRYVTMPLAKHVQLVRHRRRLFQLTAISVLAVCSVGYSGSNLWHEQRRKSDYAKSIVTLSSTIYRTKKALIDESPHGIVLSDALLDTEALKSSASASPAMLLTIVATVFTQHRELELQELRWVVIDDIADKEAEYKNVSPLRVTFRRRISAEHQLPSKLAVVVEGNIQASATLREQQGALDAVVAMLERYHSIDNLVVLEAPLTKVAAEDRIGADALDLATSFRIQFQIDRSLSNEV